MAVMTRNALKLASMILALGAGVSTPAQTLPPSPTTLCKMAPAQIAQAASLKSGTPEARKALYNSKTAVQLCEAGAKSEAQKKFKVAYNALGLDFAAALAQTTGQAN
jgi:hypothetical protein